MDSTDARFAGIARLYGPRGLECFQQSHVMVVGVGGVGSWSVEALARSGVGELTLVDLDEVCVSNVNRQLQALTGQVGRPKIEVLQERIALINPRCRVHLQQVFFTGDNAPELLSPGIHVVIDAIDALANKCRLIAACHDRGLPVVVCGAAGGRRDSTRIQIADLARSTHDPLLAEVRSRLRKEHGFPRTNQDFGIPSIFSTESAVRPGVGNGCEPGTSPNDSPSPRKLGCEWGYGAVTHVTGAFGFAAAGVALDLLLRRHAADIPRDAGRAEDTV